MRAIVTHAEEERFLVTEAAPQPVDGPRRDLRVAEIAVRHIEPAPVERLAVGLIRFAVGWHPVDGQHHFTATTIPEHMARIVRAFAGQLGFCVRHGVFGKRTPPLVHAVIFLEQILHSAVQHFAGAQRLIACVLKRMCEQHRLGRRLLDSRTVVRPHAGARRHQSAEHRRPRGVARRCRTMRVGEQHPALGQAIHVRRQRLRMPAKAANPVIQIIDCDEKDVRLGRSVRDDRQQTNREREDPVEKPHQFSFHVRTLRLPSLSSCKRRFRYSSESRRAFSRSAAS